MLHGSICALVTPFSDGAVDAARYESFVDWQIEQGTEGLAAQQRDLVVALFRLARDGGRLPGRVGRGA